MANLLKNGTKSAKYLLRNLSFHLANLRINKISKLTFQDITKKPTYAENRMVENRNVIPAFPRADAVANFRLISSHDCLVAHLYRLSIYPSPMCVLCKEGNSIINYDRLPDCTVLNSGNTQSLVILHRDARRWMEFPKCLSSKYYYYITLNLFLLGSLTLPEISTEK
jgi:hypothetical protein